MASNATSTYERNLVVVEIVGVCGLYWVNTGIATVCLHKTTRSGFGQFRSLQLCCWPPQPPRQLGGISLVRAHPVGRCWW